MKYKVRWVESSAYYVEIEATSPEEAIERFQDGDYNDTPEPDDEIETVTDPDSIEAIPASMGSYGGAV